MLLTPCPFDLGTIPDCTKLIGVNMTDFFDNLWNIIKAEFGYIYTNVSAAFNMIISEVPDDEIAIMHGAMDVGLASIKAGRSFDEAFSDVLNYVQKQEIQELSKVTEYLVKAFLASAHPDVH